MILQNIYVANFCLQTAIWQGRTSMACMDVWELGELAWCTAVALQCVAC